MLKKFTLIGLMTIIVLTIAVTPVKAETSLISVQEYEQYLLDNSIETYYQFEKLSVNEKEKIIQLLAMPNVWIGNSNDPDVKYSEQKENSNILSIMNQRSSDKSTWHEQYVHIFGLKILAIKSEIGYRTQGRSIVRINYHNTYVTVNLNPLLQISKNSQTSWIGGNGNYAVGSAIFKASFGVAGFSSQFKTAKTMFYVYESGKKEFTFN